LAVLYNEILKEQDKLIVSKGHCAAALYSALWATKDKIPNDWIKDYCKDGSKLHGLISHHVPDVELSTGSLGHGLSVACGMALVRKGRVFCLLSDGELNEGSVWEAIMFASHHKLDNLILIIDNNGLQSMGNTKNIINMSGILKKFEAFGWMVKTTNGNSVPRLIATLSHLRNHHFKQPKCIIADTIKGKGVSWMEGQLEWHYKYPSDEELKLALGELA
jgi:transketolase